MENPYRAPLVDAAEPAPIAALPGVRRRSWAVSQTRLVSILMIVQGALEVLTGIVLIGAAIFLINVLSHPTIKTPAAIHPLETAVGYFVMGTAAIVPGGLHLWAGITNLSFRSYTLGLVALGATGLSLFSCFCAPTGIGLMIYGLVVYLQPEIPEAFQLGENGHSVESILHAYQ